MLLAFFHDGLFSELDLFFLFCNNFLSTSQKLLTTVNDLVIFLTIYLLDILQSLYALICPVSSSFNLIPRGTLENKSNLTLKMSIWLSIIITQKYLNNNNNIAIQILKSSCELISISSEKMWILKNWVHNKMHQKNMSKCVYAKLKLRIKYTGVC